MAMKPQFEVGRLEEGKPTKISCLNETCFINFSFFLTDGIATNPDAVGSGGGDEPSNRSTGTKCADKV